MKSFKQFLLEVDAKGLTPWGKSYLAAWESIDGPAPKERTYKQVVAAREEHENMDPTVAKIYNALMAGPKGVVPEPPFAEGGSLSVDEDVGTMAVTKGHLADITHRAPDTLISLNKKTTSERLVQVTSFRDAINPGMNRFRFQIHSTQSDGTKGPIIHEVLKCVGHTGTNNYSLHHISMSPDTSINEKEADRITRDHWFADIVVGKNKELKAIADHHYPY